jgi:hypothetical protein
LDSIFGMEKMDVEVLDQAAEVAGRFLYSPEAMDF